MIRKKLVYFCKKSARKALYFHALGIVVKFISEVSDSEQTKEQFCSKQELL